MKILPWPDWLWVHIIPFNQQYNHEMQEMLSLTLNNTMSRNSPAQSRLH